MPKTAQTIQTILSRKPKGLPQRTSTRPWHREEHKRNYLYVTDKQRVEWLIPVFMVTEIDYTSTLGCNTKGSQEHKKRRGFNVGIIELHDRSRQGSTINTCTTRDDTRVLYKSFHAIVSNRPCLRGNEYP